jgi:uncharacterized protein DUF420
VWVFSFLCRRRAFSPASLVLNHGCRTLRFSGCAPFAPASGGRVFFTPNSAKGILITLRRAWTERFDKHRQIARWTLLLWFYVSVTGAIVCLMVYQIYAPQ